jgi:hypothetical protein
MVILCGKCPDLILRDEKAVNLRIEVERFSFYHFAKK